MLPPCGQRAALQPPEPAPCPSPLGDDCSQQRLFIIPLSDFPQRRAGKARVWIRNSASRASVTTGFLCVCVSVSQNQEQRLVWFQELKVTLKQNKSTLSLFFFYFRCWTMPLWMCAELSSRCGLYGPNCCRFPFLLGNWK